MIKVQKRDKKKHKKWGHPLSWLFMLATILDDTWNVHNMQHINPNSKRKDYSDIPNGGHKKIQGPSHMVEGGCHLHKAPNPHGHGEVELYYNCIFFFAWRPFSSRRQTIANVWQKPSWTHARAWLKPLMMLTYFQKSPNSEVYFAGQSHPPGEESAWQRNYFHGCRTVIGISRGNKRLYHRIQRQEAVQQAAGPAHPWPAAGLVARSATATNQIPVTVTTGTIETISTSSVNMVKCLTAHRPPPPTENGVNPRDNNGFHVASRESLTALINKAVQTALANK